MPTIGSTPLSNIALCKVEDVTALIDPSIVGDNLQLIALLINDFSAWMEQYLNRKLLKTTYTEILDGGKHILIVSAPPIVNNGTLRVYEDSTRVFDSSKLLVLNKDYRVEYTNGALRRVVDGDLRRPRYAFLALPQAVKVIYQGGLVANDEATGEIDVHPALRGACAKQVAYWFQNRQNMGLQSVSNLGNWAQSFSKPTDLLPGVASELSLFRLLDVF